MVKITSFEDLLSEVKKGPFKTLVIANGVDEHSIAAASHAIDLGIVKVIITGFETEILRVCSELTISPLKFEIVNCITAEEATNKAVELARSGRANSIMKGFIGTEVYMKAILNKTAGLLTPGELLKHITLLHNTSYHKLLVVSDVAIIPLPTLQQKEEIVRSLISVAHQIGIVQPKVAFIAATEKLITQMPACIEANLLFEIWKNGGFPNSICAGPMALDIAIDKSAAEIKNFISPVAGDADCLLFPNIESGNVFYKTNTKFCNAKTAAIVHGTLVPTVLSSRGDSMETKLNSIALAALIG